MMIEPQFGYKLAAIYLILALFGIGYNAAVAFLEKNKMSEGYVSDLVAAGVALTLMPFLALDGTYQSWQIITALFGGFIASGLPMMVGAKIRHARTRKDEQQAAKLARCGQGCQGRYGG